MLGTPPPPGLGLTQHMLRLISSMDRPPRYKRTPDRLLLALDTYVHARLGRGASYVMRYTPPVPAKLALWQPLTIGSRMHNFHHNWHLTNVNQTSQFDLPPHVVILGTTFTVGIARIPASKPFLPPPQHLEIRPILASSLGLPTLSRTWPKQLELFTTDFNMPPKDVLLETTLPGDISRISSSSPLPPPRS